MSPAPAQHVTAPVQDPFNGPSAAPRYATPIIAHLDMDCFFAQIEQKRRAELAGLPVVVGADPHHGHGRGVVCTANYEARRFGIKSAMPISKAYALCPAAMFLPVDYRHYSAVSRHIFSIAGAFCKTERTGIDEGYLDLGACRDFEEGQSVAFDIKKAILEKTGLTCSIGIAWNKRIAKIASEMQKPDGLTVIRSHELEAKIWPLAADKMPGIGPHTKSRLERIGIKSIGQIAQSKPRFLAESLGAWGLGLYAAAWGSGSAELGGFWQPKSISRETTFGQDTDDWVALRVTLDELSRRVHADAVSENAFFRTVGVKVRFANFETHTHARTIKTTQALDRIKATVKALMQPALESSRKIRLVGVRLSGLTDATGQTRLEQFYSNP